MADLTLQLGIKTDPAQYRFSYEWLFRLLADEGIENIQLGTFFEIYQLPDDYFVQLRRQAEDLGLRIRSIFTAHRELGGFFIDGPGWEAVARRNFERLIEVGSLLGASSVGSNPGAVYRDRMGTKQRGIECYLRHMKELMEFACRKGVPRLTVEPMSCLAEPPTLPQEIRQVADELMAHHRRNPNGTARLGYCTDIAHGYADAEGTIRHDHIELLEATLPYLYEIHLKNTDSQYSSTFGFSAEERKAGVVQIGPIREMLLARAETIPVDEVVGYLEIGGPKLGRDYSDKHLADQLRASLSHLKETWLADGAETNAAGDSASVRAVSAVRKEAPAEQRPVRVSPSVMCVDLGHIEDSLRQLEAVGADLLHLDMADGHFVPNLLLGLDVIRWLRPKTALPLDVHLMVENPDLYIEPLAEIGVDYVAVHAEVCRHLDRTLTQIRELGMKAGVVLNPATPLPSVEFVVERLDFVLLMTVNPGFAGQRLVPSGIRKIAACRRFLGDRGLEAPIMVDGNVSFEHIPKMVAAGADILVAGTSSWFHRGASLAENVRKTEAAIAEGLRKRSG
ncbi:MAG: ribulose-phosphate 3-epimerase [Pirellulales bacterium]|nr:ribulose-phosphate 3-epimerase [Pirellulales bacterium]